MISLDQLRASWGWAFPAQIDAILDYNVFGNLLVVCQDDIYRIAVEDSVVVKICPRSEYNLLWANISFLEDWSCEKWVSAFGVAHGNLPNGYIIGFVTPTVLGGEYAPENWRAKEPSEYIQCYGHIARQIASLPEGSQVNIKIVP